MEVGRLSEIFTYLLHPRKSPQCEVAQLSWPAGVQSSPALEPQAPRSAVHRTEQSWCLVGALSLCMFPFPIQSVLEAGKSLPPK